LGRLAERSWSCRTGFWPRPLADREWRGRTGDRGLMQAHFLPGEEQPDPCWENQPRSTTASKSCACRRFPCCTAREHCTREGPANRVEWPLSESNANGAPPAPSYPLVPPHSFDGGENAISSSSLSVQPQKMTRPSHGPHQSVQIHLPHRHQRSEPNPHRLSTRVLRYPPRPPFLPAEHPLSAAIRSARTVEQQKSPHTFITTGTAACRISGESMPGEENRSRPGAAPISLTIGRRERRARIWILQPIPAPLMFVRPYSFQNGR
jgi:hypothetical protein